MSKWEGSGLVIYIIYSEIQKTNNFPRQGHDEQTQKDANELASILRLIFLVLLLYKINQTHKIRWK